MHLSQIIEALGQSKLPVGCADNEVKGVTHNSRRAGPGMIFAALKGQNADGHDYVEAAAQAGALAALVEQPMENADGLCQIQVPETRKALAQAAHEYYGRPSQKMTCVGITGTNGKTTTSYFLESVLDRRGKVGVIGTVDVRFAGLRQPSAMTTPESDDLAALLWTMREAGVDQAVLEVSSHALSQHRADELALDAAVFTNLSRDHLDYHGGMEAYFEAKSRLFTEILPASRKMDKPALAVCFGDDPWGARMAKLAGEQGLEVWTYGLNENATVRAQDIELSLEGCSCKLVWPQGEFQAATPLVGGYNVLNLLAAASVGLGLGMDPDQVRRGLQDLAGVPGRLQRIGGSQDKPAVFVDYAHTDDALRHALGALKPLCKGNLICVFGAGGDRDHGKRPLMGKAVAEIADIIILTSDNPRSEDPLAIMAMVGQGIKDAGGNYLNEPDRSRAIDLAIAGAGKDDVVLIAGKGHEDYQIVGDERRQFDDREHAANALAVRQGEA